MAPKIPPRTESNLLESWDSFAAPLHASSLFKKIGGLSLISATLTRKVWIRTNPALPCLFPNLYIILCGPPGAGKDMVIGAIRSLIIKMMEGMEQQSGINLAPESLSTKGLIDALADENSRLTFSYCEKGKTVTAHYQSLYIANGELGAFLPEYNTQFVSIINDLFNCKPSFSERVRGRGTASTLTIENPHLCMLLGTQPAIFARIIPLEAWQMGLTARLLICNADEAIRRPVFTSVTKYDTTLFDRIASDLRALSFLAGEYKPNKDYQDKLNAFHMENPGAITHSRFEDYNVRRSLHLNKIAMCVAAAQSNELVLTGEHFDQALAYLKLSEKDVSKLFDNLLTSQGFQDSVEQVLHSSATLSTVTHAELERKLRRTHKPAEVGQIIRSMLQAEDIVFSHYNGGVPVYNVNTKVV